MSTIRQTDTLSSERSDLVRLGGDEFVLLVEGLRMDSDALTVAERVYQSVAAPITIGEHKLHASFSMGIAIGCESYTSAQDILRDADTALYRAKEEGRGRYCVFSDDLHKSAMARWQTETDLRRGIEERQLILEYQPIVALGTGVIVHFEALVRWNHPTRGLVPPNDFIPLAEETGLIVPLGRWVLEEACRQIVAWRRELGEVPITVAVNVASRQLVRPTFADEVAATLAANGLPPAALAIEVTESFAMDKNAVLTCEKLRDLGVHLHLDDFGTGYSSLSYLHRMPIHALKIDRSFTSTMRTNKMNGSIVQAVIALANALGIECIAEGIETAADREFLFRYGCANGQGWHFAKALHPDAALKMLATGITGKQTKAA